MLDQLGGIFRIFCLEGVGFFFFFPFLVFSVHNHIYDDEKLSTIEIDATSVRKKRRNDSLGFVPSEGFCFNEGFVPF